MVAISTSTTNAAALGELNSLQAAMSSALAEAKQAAADLRALQDAANARAKKRADLEAAIESKKKQAGLSGLGEVRRRVREPFYFRRPARGLGDLAGGASAWETGQYQKVEDWANQGAFATMLEAAMRLAFTGAVQPEDALRDDASFAKLQQVVTDATPNVPTLRALALRALTEMRKSVLGQPSALPFDRAEYDAAVQGDLRYIQTHKPNAGFVTKTLRDVGNVVTSLDRYVPGWGVLLDVASPVIPVLPGLVGLLESAIPVAGDAARAITSATPLIGGGGVQPLAPSSPVAFGARSAIVAPADAGVVAGLTPLSPVGSSELLTQATQTVTGPLGAVKFQLTKSAAQAASQGMGVLEALEKTGQDLLDGYALAIELVGFFVTGPEVVAFQGAITALETSISLAKTYQAAQAMRAAAARAKAAAVQKAAQDDAGIAGLQAELTALLRKLGQLKSAVVPAGSSGATKAAALLLGAWLLSEVLA